MALVKVEDYRFPGGWTDTANGRSKAEECCRKLEAGDMLYFSQPPFEMADDDRQLLLGQRQSNFSGHKNISYRPKTDELRGAATGNPEESRMLREIMGRFSKNVIAFVDSFLSPYASKRKLDFASYRPIEEQNRNLPLHKRNDLAHVDAFPSRPTHGGRILRVFLNINPSENRVWETTDAFDVIAPKYAEQAGLKTIASPSAVKRAFRKFAPVWKAVGMKGADRSDYDRFMLRFHDWLKENADYQKNYPKLRTEFPPNSVWMVYTDTVPHAVLSGKFALEQTFIVPLHAMVKPETAPIRILESMCGKQLASV
jgi:hypothetical protein